MRHSKTPIIYYDISKPNKTSPQDIQMRLTHFILQRCFLATQANEYNFEFAIFESDKGSWLRSLPCRPGSDNHSRSGIPEFQLRITGYQRRLSYYPV